MPPDTPGWVTRGHWGVDGERSIGQAACPADVTRGGGCCTPHEVGCLQLGKLTTPPSRRGDFSVAVQGASLTLPGLPSHLVIVRERPLRRFYFERHHAIPLLHIPESRHERTKRTREPGHSSINLIRKFVFSNHVGNNATRTSTVERCISIRCESIRHELYTILIYRTTGSIRVPR